MFNTKLKIQTFVAPNPGPMTGPGTNSYILGQDEVLIVDPGPMLKPHIDILAHQVRGRTVTGIFVTHAHLDHSPAASRLADRLNCPVIAAGDAAFGQSPLMMQLSRTADLGGGEGTDDGFAPDVIWSDGEHHSLDGVQITALHTPGHFGNHMSLAFDDILISGDLVMDWSTTLISPPDGDLGSFYKTCDRLIQRPEMTYLTGHGNPILDGPTRLKNLINHRKKREAQILAVLNTGPQTAEALAALIYTEITPNLLPAAARNVFAHLIDLYEQNQLSCIGDFGFSAKFKKT